MSELILRLSEVMRAEIRGLDVLANNAANVATPGYRSQRPVAEAMAFSERLDGALQARSVMAKGEGPLQTTGKATDLALRGDAWFVLETPGGPCLTRDGRFRLDAEGTLRSRQGYPVMGESGAINGLSEKFVVGPDGTVSQEGTPVARLRLLKTPSSESPRALGDGLYRYEREPERTDNGVVLQGGYEGSNVDTAADMLQLMRSTRHIESVQRSISAYDQMLGTGINQIGKP